MCANFGHVHSMFSKTIFSQDPQEETQFTIFTLNSQVKKQLNVARTGENFQNKMNAAHRKLKEALSTSQLQHFSKMMQL